MRRLNLSTKMLVAALPLIVAVVTLLAISVRSDLNDINEAEHGAELGGVWQPLIDTLGAIEFEADPANAGDTDARSTTNANVNELRDSITVIGAADAAGDHVTKARSALSAARRNLDMATLAPDLQTEIDPAEAYAEAGRELVAVGELLPAEAGDPALGSELLAVVKLADAKLAADQILYGVTSWQEAPSNVAALTKARSDFGSLDTLLGEFEAIAPDDWATEFRQSGFTTQLTSYRSQLDQVSRAAQVGDTATFDTEGFDELVNGMVDFQTTISNQIVDRANAEADATSSATLRRIGIILVITLIALVLAWIISRSITKRIKAVAKGANQVSTEQLPSLVSALRDPKGKGSLPEIERIPANGTDELSELAGAFNSMQDTLVDVAKEQVEVLRRGVSDIFVTMARRNRSLIDRQLAMLDEFEAEVDDHEVLSNYYQLDHMATRMRRNSESLLVLANAEPKRRRVRATEVDDVVRAAIGEVEDYRRIEIEALESLQVRGNVVADVSHLLAELLDNATSFSPPDSYVRVGGRMAEQGYMIRIVDNGVGMGTQRLKDLNELLREPPVVGLSVESTLGMSVVSLLANKHGITVKLASGNPGLIVDVLLPPSLYGPIDAQPSAAPATAVATMQAAPPQKPIVAWDDNALTAGAPTDETFETQGPVTTYESAAPATAGPAMGDDDRPVTQSDWRAMSLNLTAFQQGMRSASDSPERVDADDEVFEPAEPVVAEAPVDEIHSSEDEADATDEIPLPEADVDAIDEIPLPDVDAIGDTDHEDTDVEDTEYALVDHDLVDGVQESADAEPADPEIADAESVETLTTPITNDIEQTVSFVERDDDEVGVPEDHQTLQAPDTPDTSVEQTAGADQESIEALAAQVADDPTDAEVFAAAPTPDEALTVPSLPPPAGGPRAEFSVPPAPPMTASGPRPVSPDNARTVSRPAVQQEAAPSLPTRSPSDGPDGGPDRLANALDAALPTRSPSPGPDGGYDRLSGDNAPMPLDAAEGSLPTRTRVGDPSDPVEEPLATAQSNSDPDALRDRLRAFQAEFRSALSTDDVDHSDGNGAQDHNHESANHDHAEEAGRNHLDLGGDRR